MLGGVAIIASIIGTFAVKSAAGNVERALYQGLVLVGPHRRDRCSTRSPSGSWTGICRAAGTRPSVGDLYLCSLDRPRASRRACSCITDYYTSTRFSPVKKTSAASQTGHATNIIQGFAQRPAGHGAARARARARHLRRLRSSAGIYGIGVAVDGAALALPA